MKIKRIKYFEDWNLFEICWLIISTLLILSLSIYWKSSFIGVVAAITGIWSVILVAKGKISNYYFGFVNIVTYSYVAFGSKYYGEVMLNMLYFLPMQFFGLYLWKKNREKNLKSDVKAKLLSNKSRVMWLLVIIIATICYGYFLLKIGANKPYLDGLSVILSIIAMILMAYRYVEQWILWIVVDILTIALWIFAILNGGNDIAILVMWVAYLVNAIYGFVNWIKLSKIKDVR